MQYENLPDILTAERISKFLGISRRVVYDLTNIEPEKGGMKCFYIGRSKRVDKKDLFRWIEHKKETASES